MHRFLVSAAHKSSGKTTLSVGLAAALRQRRLSVQPFKKGPDYIDPLWLGLAAGRSCCNLDFFLSPDDEIRAQFARHGFAADVCLIEGNKGLYDGLDLKGSNSNAALARLLGLPVILVLDARGMTRGIAPLVLGYQAFDREINIAGVILNRLGGRRHESKLRAVIEHYTDVPVIGAVQEDSRLALVERHLGLMPANEAGAAERHVAEIAEVVAQQVDLDRLLTVTATKTTLPQPLPLRVSSEPHVRIAIARDTAFGFYYADDLDALRNAGVELLPFDACHDTHLPTCDGLFIGGGFPESFIDELEANASLRADIRIALDDGMPAYAECGGLMYLARSITWKGRQRQMVGAIAGDIVMHEKPVGRGYVVLQTNASHPWARTAAASDGQPPVLRAHEFHYSSIENLPADTCFAYAVERGHGVDGKHDGIIYKNLLASYTHLRATAGCDWPARFVQFVRSIRESRKSRAQPESHPCSK
ncbi:MAG: hydrogenobyrinic acid a,c-diamide synthase (glutamine-hydrolyzing) [Gammaproteobacteria bacterium]|nr:hydrogenobyrinic acid a,c-diamide synthase (glutamine-hydrolyzing) [Gammaproteobacteria bacterium]MBU1647237.1 hydrogenobyrinic acid a,c-diamide synthase (glutamine-hydrolyzing) [Gammaproteobacteria bacterium]MBU1972749.1 hydrogenobyrinic acid a,c-diamide synthase (glutamine-hydrolyzing) [Gammaproteobacteria bacterium]